MKSKNEMTLDRALSRFGVASRTAASEAIRSGRVKVNGRIVKDPEIWVNPQASPIHLDGERLHHARRVYFLFYKPKGVITSHGDPSGRKTVYDCLEQLLSGNSKAGCRNDGSKKSAAGLRLPWVAPVGRLDKDTSGLLILTNDNDFADHVTSPESGIPKTYLVKANTLVSDETLARMESGLELKRGDWAKPVSVRRVEDRGKYSWLEIVLTEGKNREVRRLLEAVGLKTLKLVRTRIGPCTLGGLEVGKLRPLTSKEVALLGKH